MTPQERAAMVAAVETIVTEFKWAWNVDPAAPGWYAIAYCYDSDERTFSSVDYWNGKKWNEDFAVLGIAGPFDTEDAAFEWEWVNVL